MPGRPKKRTKEYRGPGGLIAHPGEPAPNGPGGISVAAHAFADYSPLIRLVAKQIYEGWRDEAGEHRRFIGTWRQQWGDMRQDDRALFCAMAERVLVFFAHWNDMDPGEKTALVKEAASPWLGGSQ